MREEELKKLLLKENEEFRKANKLHQQYEKKLEKLKAKSYLTDSERQEEKELKKKKLILKDKMYFLMAEYKKSL
ncbi:MAG: hypothetical protein OEY25_08645 [Candidatus Aminicenantes bacterium]|nr:hypothetical protein [Candidatus Aminicenantes bacterium]MDH5704637.1 hypothetical protein [Candidatus Aminicenantes bacterium]